MNKQKGFLLTLGGPLDGVRRALLLGQLHQFALAVGVPGGHSARVHAHVDLLHRAGGMGWKMSKKKREKRCGKLLRSLDAPAWLFLTFGYAKTKIM